MMSGPFDEIRKSLAELAEIEERLDKTAKNTIVGGIERMIDTVSKEVPSSRSAVPDDYSSRDAAWAEFRSLGFGAVSAFEPEEWLARPAEERSVSEFALSSDGTIVANVFSMSRKSTGDRGPYL